MADTFHLNDSGFADTKIEWGTYQYTRLCEWLRLSPGAQIGEVEAAFAERGWLFTITDGSLSLAGDDDQEIPDPEELESLAFLFADGSFVEFDADGEPCRMLFQNLKAIWAEGEVVYDARVYGTEDELNAQIELATERLTALEKQKLNWC